jgi:hypothetical protein
MSAQNQISIEIPQAVIDSVTQKLQDCKTELAPYLQGLTSEQRQTLFKMGDKTLATVQKIESYIKSNPEFIPAYMNTSDFSNDVTAVNQLKEINNLASQLATDVNDTSMLAGSEALMSGMLYYGTVKEAYSKGVVTAKTIYEDLQERFSKKKRKGLGT